MKIPHSVDGYYNGLMPSYRLLKEMVDGIMTETVKREDWHYISRIKSAESYYVKAQQSRWNVTNEDIFACTLVVPNPEGIQHAIGVLSQVFVLDHRKPECDNKTHKGPESFVFDDIRLYLKFKRPKNPELEGLIFECQVKTFLQHAWTIATHDLIYKPNEGAAWAAARVAFEVKAMLEHAEVAISSVNQFAGSPLLAKTSRYYVERDRIMSDLKSKEVDLGQCKYRVVDNIMTLLKAFNCTWLEVFAWLQMETSKGEGRGINQLSISIYEVVLDVILRYKTDAVVVCQRFIQGTRKGSKLFAPKELLELRPEIGEICSSVG